MTANDKCPRCDETETLDHKLYTCVYTERIWNVVTSLTGESLMPEPLSVILAARIDQVPAVLTVKAEIIGRILGLPWEQTYLIHPKHFVTLAIESLIKKENKTEMKDALKDILSGL